MTMPIPIPNNYIAGGILALGLLISVWCLIKGEGYAKQIKWILIFFFLAAFVTSDKFYSLRALDVLANLTNLDQYVGQLNDVTAKSVQKLNETYELKLESLLAKIEKTEKMAHEARALMRLSVESAVYDQAIKNNPELVRKRLNSVAPYLFSDQCERDQWLESMLQILEKE